jgi:nucleotide-binding universal stress UspA family protein
MYQKILVPVDGSDTSNRGLDEALRLARLTGAQLRLVHVIDELSLMIGMESFAALSADTVRLLREGGQQILADARRRAAAAGVQAETVLVDSFTTGVCDEILRQCDQWGADLVVLGTHGRRGVRRLFMGSDAEQIVRLAATPVLLVRAAGKPVIVSG